MEVAASSSLPVGHALAMSVARGKAHAGYINDELVALYGVATLNRIEKVGCPWMVGTDTLEMHPITVLRHNRKVLGDWRGRFDRLINYVDARNTVSKRWLKWLDFRLHPAAAYGPQRLDFHKFEWRR